MKKEILRIENATLEKDGIVYLDNFSLFIPEKEIMGIVGTNHHGIEEMIQLICNNSLLKYGRVYLRETLVNTYLKEVKKDNKVFIIDSKSRLIQDLTVADNIFVLRKGFRKYVINQKALAIQVKHIFMELNIDINPYLLVEQLSQFERCIVELVKAVLIGTNLIIIRSISEMLSGMELKNFQELIRYYAKKGISFLYIANHHEEIFEICSKAALLEDGKVVKIFFHHEMDDKHMEPFIKQIKETNRTYLKEKVMLQFYKVDTSNLKSFSFHVSEGECLAILDSDNTALQDIVNVANGTIQKKAGTIVLDGQSIDKKNISIQEKVWTIYENPVKTMLFQEMSYMENLCFLIDRKINLSVIKSKYFKSIKKEYKKELGVDIESSRLNELSQQSLYNIVYYRVLLCRPKVVFIMQPFIGADMYLRSYIAKLMNRLKKEGVAVVLLTSQMTDILAVSDRLVIIKDGKIDIENQEENKQMIYNNYYGNRFAEKTKL